MISIGNMLLAEEKTFLGDWRGGRWFAHCPKSDGPAEQFMAGSNWVSVTTANVLIFGTAKNGFQVIWIQSASRPTARFGFRVKPNPRFGRRKNDPIRQRDQLAAGEFKLWPVFAFEKQWNALAMAGSHKISLTG